MASVGRESLLEETLTATKIGKSTSMDAGHIAFVVFQRATNFAGLTSIDVVIEHSPDGTNWFTLVTMPQMTGDDADISQIDLTNVHVLPSVRANVTIVGAGSVDLRVDLYHDTGK